MRRWTLAEYQKVLEWRAEKPRKQWKEIARLLDRNDNCVRCKLAYHKRKRLTPVSVLAHQVMTAQRDAQVAELWHQWLTRREIAEQLQLSVSQVARSLERQKLIWKGRVGGKRSHRYAEAAE